MLRTTFPFRCVASATTIEKATSFRPLPLYSWMQQQRSSSLSKINEPGSRKPHFFGTKCGPHATLFFPPASSATSLDRYAPLFSKAQLQHGVLCLPYFGASDTAAQLAEKLTSAVNARRTLAKQLRGDCSTSDAIVHRTQRQIDQLDDGFFTEYCHDLVSTMDRLGITWSNACVAQSFGSLVATKLSLLYPERVGSLVLLDTTLVNDKTSAFSTQLRDLRKAATDVNVPQELFEFTKEEFEPLSLSSHLVVVEKSADDDDAKLIRAALGEPSTKSLADADVNAWMTVEQLRLVQHPMCLVVPGNGAHNAVAAHEALFHVRRVAKVKSAAPAPAAASSESKPAGEGGKKEANNSSAAAAAAAATTVLSVIDDKCLQETADHIVQWTKRFDSDEIISRRWSQAKNEMQKLMAGGSSSGSSAAGGAGAAGDDKGGKKGGGKKGKKEKEKEKK